MSTAALRARLDRLMAREPDRLTAALHSMSDAELEQLLADTEAHILAKAEPPLAEAILAAREERAAPGPWPWPPPTPAFNRLRDMLRTT